MTDYGKVDLYGLVRTGLFDGRGINAQILVGL
jgi:hypothetical protein